MIWFRKWTILIHRYLGIVLSLLFVIWFLSGIAMIFARDMPRLTPAVRLERMPSLDPAQILVSPSEAVRQAGVTRNPGRMLLLTITDRPAYRFVGRTPVTVFADTGAVLKDLGSTDAVTIASRFMHLPEDAVHHAGVLTHADQWTIAQRRQMPLHKVVVDDEARTELYVSPQLGEVVVQTTRASRALAWVAAIPHWLYFTSLRVNDAAWRQVILWSSGLGTLAAILGLVLAFTQFKGPFRFASVSASIPYAGWMRWHYITGVLFGVFALTWVFSGLLSMGPWDWASGGGSGAGIRQALSGGALDLSRVKTMSADAWQDVLSDNDVKEAELLQIQGEPYYVLRGTGRAPRLLDVTRWQIRREMFSIDSLLARIRDGNPGVSIVESATLPAYDAYYRQGDQEQALPVLRVKFGDPDRTWVYVDPRTSQLVGRFTRLGRLERWLYHGLHSLDFPFWSYNGLSWKAVMIALNLGGAVLSAIGVYIGFKRLRRSVRGA